MGKVLEHSHLAHKVLRNLTSGEDRALAQLCIVMNSPVDRKNENNKYLRNKNFISYKHIK